MKSCARTGVPPVTSLIEAIRAAGTQEERDADERELRHPEGCRLGAGAGRAVTRSGPGELGE